jgi:hypothetical protein
LLLEYQGFGIVHHIAVADQRHEERVRNNREVEISLRPAKTNVRGDFTKRYRAHAKPGFSPAQPFFEAKRFESTETAWRYVAPKFKRAVRAMLPKVFDDLCVGVAVLAQLRNEHRIGSHAADDDEIGGNIRVWRESSCREREGSVEPETKLPELMEDRVRTEEEAWRHDIESNAVGREPQRRGGENLRSAVVRTSIGVPEAPSKVRGPCVLALKGRTEAISPGVEGQD